MKHLAALFLIVCFGLGSAVPLYSNDLELKKINRLVLNADGADRINDVMKDLFEEMRERLKNSFEDGKGIQEQHFMKAQEVYEKLKNLADEIKDKIKDVFEDIRNKKSQNGPANADIGFPLHGPTSSDADIFSIFDMFKRLRQLIKEKLDAGELKTKVEKIFGKGSELAEQIINMLKEKGEKGKKKVLDWIDRIIPDKEERSISEVYEKIREFFKDLHIDLKEKFCNFGEWVKEQYEKGLEKGKTKAENIKRIAKEFLHDTRQISKDVAGEALDFFREYKKDLGIVFDNIRDKARRILKED